MTERIPIDRLIEVAWVRTWQSAAATIRLGQTGDLRWVAWHSERGDPYTYWDERAACTTISRWVSRGNWLELPAEHVADLPGQVAGQ